MLTAHRSNRTFATRSNGPRVPNIHLLTQDELVQLKLMWPSPGGVAFEHELWRAWTPADEPIAPPTTSAYEDETSRERTVCSWQRVQLTHALHADLCLHNESNFISDYIRTHRFATTGMHMNWRDCAPLVRLYQQMSSRRKDEGESRASHLAVEIGGNIGTCSVELLLRCPEAHLAVFEPNPSNLFYLTSSLKAVRACQFG